MVWKIEVMMKLFITYTMLLFCLNTVAMGEETDVASTQLDEIENKALIPFFNALKSGNVVSIKRYLAGEKYEKYRSTSSEDREYEKMLREHYKGATFSVERASIVDGQVVVDVLIEFPGRGRQLTQFYLQDQADNLENGKRDQNQARKKADWRIIIEKNGRAP
jgi:hypothetical protein